MAEKPNKHDIQHLKDMELYARRIDNIFNEATREAAALGISIDNFNPDKPFSFADYPNTKARIDKLIKTLTRDVQAVIVNGVRSEWTLANNKNNALCDLVFGDNKNRLTKAQERKYYSNNDKAREAFETRKTAGLNLSDKVWNYSNQFKNEIEMGLDLGLREGLPADYIACDLKKYLKEPSKLFRRVRDEHGQLQLSRNAKAYNPGAGVYRSSYKNAMRLARTETNMAYRTADYERWQEMDFVVGIEIRLSNNHTLNGKAFTDICDDLKGKYPKDFKFTGWHPQCRCHAVSILKTPEELMANNERIMNGEETNTASMNEVKGVPENFKSWVKDSEDRIEKANYRGTLPYFLKDNTKHAGITVNENNVIDRIVRIKEATKKYNEYKTNEWDRVYFDKISGGYNVFSKEHQFTPTGGGGDAEKAVGKMLAKLGKQVEFLPENGKGKGVPDLAFDGKTWDIKTITKANENTVRTYIKDARKADNVIFQWDGSVNKLEELKSAVTRTVGYFKGKNAIEEMPRVFYMNQNGLLKQLY